MTVCPAGHYCPQRPVSDTPVLCPSSYYCPQGAIQPTRCFNGTYCPTGSDFYRWCPLGYFGSPASNNTYDSIASACAACPAGRYGTDPVRRSCERCPAGYVCLGATSSARPTDMRADNGYRCPKGHYCPTQSSIERACPVGTFNPDQGGTNVSACRQCGEDTYQNSKGSAACKTCSSSSYTDEKGSTACVCKGLNRAFQPHDGFCMCTPGFVFFDDSFSQSVGDGSVDCQPQVYTRCADNEVRDQSGECVSANDCSSCGETAARTPNAWACASATISRPSTTSATTTAVTTRTRCRTIRPPARSSWRVPRATRRRQCRRRIWTGSSGTSAAQAHRATCFR